MRLLVHSGGKRPHLRPGGRQTPPHRGNRRRGLGVTFPKTLTLAAAPHTDLFIDPAGADPVLNAPRSLEPMPDNDFQLSARVTVDFGQTYDAGVLLIWADECSWAKLCFERSPQGNPM